MLTRKRKYDDETPKHLQQEQGGLEALEQMNGGKKLCTATNSGKKEEEQKPHTRRVCLSTSSSSSSEEKTRTRKKRQVVETTSAEESSSDSSGKRRKVHSKRYKKSMATQMAHKSSFDSPKAVSTMKKASTAVPQQISPLSLPQSEATAVMSSLNPATLPVVSPLSGPKPAPESAAVTVSSLKSAPKAASSYTRRKQVAAIDSENDKDLRDDDDCCCSRSIPQEERCDDNVILEEPPVVVHRQPRRKGGWCAAIAVLLSMVIAHFFSEPSLVVITVQEGVKQWCAVQAPQLVLPTFTNSLSKEQSCRSKYQGIARTRDACISTTVPNETIAGITDKLRDWTVQYICSADSFPNITPVSTTDNRPFSSYSRITDEESKKQTNLKSAAKAKKLKGPVVTEQAEKDTAVAVRPSRGVKFPLVRRIRLFLMAVLTTLSSTMLWAISGALLSNVS